MSKTNSKAVAVREQHQVAVAAEYSEREMALLKSTICKGCTDDEVNLFARVCRHTGLDAFSRQIYPVKRKSSIKNEETGQWEKRDVMTIQTGIDGYRLIAERTGRYCPGKEPTFVYDKNGKVLSATAYLKKQTADGTWHEVSATAYFNEYAQAFTDKRTGESKLGDFWQSKPHVMISKCAEALVLRRAFPAELSGLYTQEEMPHVEDGDVVEVKQQAAKSAAKPIVTVAMAEELSKVLEQCSFEYQSQVERFMTTNNLASFNDLSVETYNRLYAKATEKMRENQTVNAEVEPVDPVTQKDAE